MNHQVSPKQPEEWHNAFNGCSFWRTERNQGRVQYVKKYWLYQPLHQYWGQIKCLARLKSEKQKERNVHFLVGNGKHRNTIGELFCSYINWWLQFCFPNVVFLMLVNKSPTMQVLLENPVLKSKPYSISWLKLIVSKSINQFSMKNTP